MRYLLMETRVSTCSSVWKFQLWNSFLLVQMVIKIDFSYSILFFHKREIIKQIILIIATFILQWWIWNISNLSIWIIRCLVFCIVFISFIWCLNISDFVLQITWSKVLIKASLRAETSATLDAYMRMSIWICTCVCYILYIRPSKEPPVQS